MRVGKFNWEDIRPELMETDAIEAMIEGLQSELEVRTIDTLEYEFNQAIRHAHDEGYRVFLDDKEINLYDLYIATEAP